jgi:hypothetical protein
MALNLRQAVQGVQQIFRLDVAPEVQNEGLDPLDTLELIDLKDLVRVDLYGDGRAWLYGRVTMLINGGERVKVFCAPQRVTWVGSIDLVQIVLKAAALEVETKTAAFATV